MVASSRPPAAVARSADDANIPTTHNATNERKRIMLSLLVKASHTRNVPSSWPRRPPAICSKWDGCRSDVVVHPEAVVRIVDGLHRAQPFERPRRVGVGDASAVVVRCEVDVGL